MFTEYFKKKSEELKGSLQKNLEKKGIQLPGKEKDLSVYRDFYDFLKEHLPDHFSLARGKVRNTRHILNKNCDVLIYKKWCQKFLDMTEGYILSDFVYSMITIEADLPTANLLTYCNHTNAIKSLYAHGKMEGEKEYPGVIPLYSILFAYSSAVPLMSHRLAIRDHSKEKEIPLNHEPDLVCILDQGVIIKDWESGGDYRIIETGSDTLMWFYILLIEFLDRDGTVGIEPRRYLKKIKEYEDY